MKHLDLHLVRDAEPDADLGPIPFPGRGGALATAERADTGGAMTLAHELERSMEDMQRRLDDVRRQLDDAYRLPDLDDDPPPCAA